MKRGQSLITDARFRDVVAFEQAASGEHFAEHDAEGPDVGALVDGLAAGLLGAHIGGGAEDHSGLRRAHADGGGIVGLHGGSAADFGKAEIQNFDGTVGLDLDVAGFEIAMNDVLGVGGFEGVGDLAGDGERFFERDRAAVYAVGEGGSFDQLHHQIVGADVV